MDHWGIYRITMVGSTPHSSAVLYFCATSTLVRVPVNSFVTRYNFSFKSEKMSVEAAMVLRYILSIFYPSSDSLLEIWNSFLESRAVGELKVMLIKVEDIVHTHHFGKVDLFVEISVHQSKVERSSEKESSNGSAFWDETVTVQVIRSVVKDLQEY